MDADSPQSPDDHPEESLNGEAQGRPDTPDEAAVRQANAAFYSAFEAQDLDAMSDVWAHGDDIACTHPGWEALHGWGAVAGAWVSLFEAEVPLQFIVTNERVRVDGNLAWVTVEENLIDQAGDDISGNTVAAVNLFRREGDTWRMVLHHGSPVVEATPLGWVEL
jgi:ketosteroid isomerase-like protein